MLNWKGVLLAAEQIMRGQRAGPATSVDRSQQWAAEGASLEDWLQDGFLDVYEQAERPETHDEAVQAVLSAAERCRDSGRRRSYRHRNHHDDIQKSAPTPEDQARGLLGEIIARDAANKIYRAVADDVIARGIIYQILRNGLQWHDTQGLADALDASPNKVKRKKELIIRRALNVMPDMRRRPKPGGSNG